MADKTKKIAADTRAKKSTKKSDKPSLGARIKKWFTNIITELKRVIWPDRKRLRQSTLTVLMIIVLSVVVILVFDTLITFVMRTTGIYSSKPKPVETLPQTAITEQHNARLMTDGTAPLLFVFDGVRMWVEG
ncbi:MAG: preprotein translocase subunit SecE [Clostridiaceae bacterium]|jgi:preprotein translocase subunit SecE|nr:preprotein translocase subunit SecE [Clostridiaceae bacterium]